MPWLTSTFKFLFLALIWAGISYAEPGISIVYRYVEGGVTSGVNPWDSEQGDCAMLLMNRAKEAFYFSDILRASNARARIRAIDDRALDHMVVARTLSTEQREFYRHTTDGTDLELSTYIETLSLVPEGERNIDSVEFDGKWYQPASVSRNVSAQKPVEMSPDGRTVTKSKFVPLPWMKEFPEYWEKHKNKFEGKFLFEEGRGAAMQKGAFKRNRALNAYMILREVLAFLPESEVIQSDAFLDRVIIFGHTTINENTERFTSPAYGFEAMEPISPGSPHAILYTTLRKRLEQYPIMDAIPSLKESLEETGESTLYAFLKRYENSYTYRQAYLRSKKDSYLVIQDQSIAAFTQLYYWDVAEVRKGFRYYRLAKRDIDRKTLPIENGLKHRMKDFPTFDFPRRWVVPISCRGEGSKCGGAEWVSAIFQSDDWIRGNLKRLEPGGVADSTIDQLVGDISTMIMIPEYVLQGETWRRYASRKVHAQGGLAVLRLSADDIKALRQAFPALDSKAKNDRLSLGVEDLKKRLMFPSIVPGIIL